MNKGDVLILTGAAIAAYFIVKKFAPSKSAPSAALTKAAANYYHTNPGSEQTRMLAEQDAAFTQATWAPGSVDATTSSGVAI